MRILLKDYLAGLTKDVVYAARAATLEALVAARVAKAFDLDVPIGGVELHVEGAANLPKRIMMVRKTRLATQAFLEMDQRGRPRVTLKRGLFSHAPALEIEMEFERSRPLESMELLRERGVEVLRDAMAVHRTLVTVDGVPLLTEREPGEGDETETEESN